MSKRQTKAQASSSRAAPPGAFGGGFGGFGSSTGTFGSSASLLSYLAEQPDLSTVSDPNVVVNFKNLSKKDSTTKAKALEDIQAYIAACAQAQQELEDGILDAWKVVYPRASIDLSRRVRQDAHALHGQICTASGKRIAKHMPGLVGPWITGLHDTDKAVARTASDAFQAVFTTPEKQANLYRVYQANILEFSRNAALEETPQTLSDERTTTSEDADAKYWRVVSSNLAVVGALLSNLPDTETQKQESLYEEFITSKRIHEFLSTNDSAVRRSVFRLINVYLNKRTDMVSTHLSQLGATLLSKSVVRHQSGSAIDFVELLFTLTRKFPPFWNSTDAKLLPITRLVDLLKAGSQGGPPRYWTTVAELFDAIPQDDIPADITHVNNLVGAMHTGITRRDEPRTHLETGWAAYVDVLNRLINKLDAEQQQSLISERAFPIVKQYLVPNADMTAWNISGPRASAILSKLLKLAPIVSIAEQEWPALADGLLERVQTSAPEQSKDYQSSQNAIAAEAGRIFPLQRQLLNSNVSQSFLGVMQASIAKIMSGSQATLKARHGKPYGAAAVLEAAVRSLTTWIFEQQDLSTQLGDFLVNELPQLISSPSKKHLVGLLYNCTKHSRFSEAWNATVEATLGLSDTSLRNSTLAELLGSPHMPQDFQAPLQSASLQTFIVTEIRDTMIGSGDPNVLNAVLGASSRVMSTESTDSVLSDMTESLTINEHASRAIVGLDTVAKKNPALLNEHLKGSMGESLIQNLLFLTESPDEEVADAASRLSKIIEGIASTQGSGASSTISAPELIQRSLAEAGPSSLSIETLVDLAKRYVSSEMPDNVVKLVPDTKAWSDSLQPFLQEPLPPALALTNALGGAIYLFQASQAEPLVNSVQRDRDGFSVPLRLALYTTRVVRASDVKITDVAVQAQLYRLLSLTIQLVIDNTGIHGSNKLWSGQDTIIEAELLDFVSDAQQLLTSWLNQSSSEPQFVQNAHEMLFDASSGVSTYAFHSGRAFAHSVSERIEAHGWQQGSGTDLEGKLKTLRRSKDVLSFAAFLVAYKVPLSTTPALTRICNELVAGLTSIRLSATTSDALQQMVFLNIIIHDQEQMVDTIARQRLIFFIQHVVPWLQDEAATVELKAELNKALCTLLPHIKDIYGGFWSILVGSLDEQWRQAKEIRTAGDASAMVPFINSSLKLAVVLQKLIRDDDTNDDLKDAWKEKKTELANGLLLLLQELGEYPDEFNLPLQITNEVLGRVISSTSVDKLSNIGDLYPLMGVESQTIQRTAFGILHKQIPLRQEQLSVDIALDKTSARLPEELLSLIINAPTLDSLASASFERSIPPVLQGYLTSWLLIFDHFQGASDKVKTDYTAHLKEGDYLNGLLSLIMDFLGHSRGKPIDASKLDIANYTAGIEDSPVKDTQWLLTHLYYLCLKRTPALTKTWWTECKSRQTVINMEIWTEKYISPLIITDALTAVTEWADNQDPNSDEALVVKSNQRSKEVNVAKEIDDQMLSLVIRLPNNFPLGQAVLHGVNRVAVDEKKWRSWLLNSQGVITFSNNSLIDGIIAFRRNVVGALKGQTECAICYSLVSADKQLPTKKCATCKNLFHGSCLYRWFKTSNSSSCPLCRNPFNYT